MKYYRQNHCVAYHLDAEGVYILTKKFCSFSPSIHKICVKLVAEFGPPYVCVAVSHSFIT